MLIERQDDLGIIEKTTYDDLTGKMVKETIYDNSTVLTQNAEARAAQPEFGKYKGNLVKAASIAMGDVIRLYNLGYDLLSSDPQETRRALCYIQSNEPHLLTVSGKPFAMKRARWV